MKKSTLIMGLCLVIFFSSTACSSDNTITLPLEDVKLGGGGACMVAADENGRKIISRLGSSNYAEWITELPDDKLYTWEMVYCCDTGGMAFICDIEIYSDDGKLMKTVKMNNLASEGFGNYLSRSVDLGELTAGTYKFIIRPTEEMRGDAIYINSVKLL